MPYITRRERDGIDAGRTPSTAGELNYFITTAVVRYMDQVNKLSYGLLAEVTGVLENVKQELYRRVAAPYEDGKVRENGDVYPYQWTSPQPSYESGQWVSRAPWGPMWEFDAGVPSDYKSRDPLYSQNPEVKR